ncbi:aldo/keto reductase [Novosphingobium flavum]|uniref:Aldo/keto reductase n=1 Tax=Novosphingobium flavum TaxID=1778672 RepID=A0A7X1FRQ3_9SPHN|nr:aldo/keto reductase [Novosphingobium flavum]MBC2665297.1 aldo/keto reductase [Novosphingobium flavum]
MTTSTDLRPLGRSGLAIRPLALGGNVFGWTADEETSHAVLDRFVDAGFSLVDTADVYSKWVPGNRGGDSEEIIGSWLAARGGRDRLVIATKVGGEMAPGASGLSARHIKQAAEASLLRLRTDHIDLYQSHYPDPGVPVDETLRAYGDLIAEGKVRAIGLSNHDPAQLRAALAAAGPGLPRYEVLQPLYNLCDRAGFERDFAPVCRAEGLGVISFKALANGFLSGKYRSPADLAGSKRAKAVKGYLDARGLAILTALDEVAARLGASPAQVAVAWVISRPEVTAPIASATSVAQVESLLGAVRLVLDADALAALDRTSAPAEAA